MAKSSKKYTAFACDQGLFGWNVMPMRLKNSRATFQRLMNSIFGDMIGRGLVVYMDDLFVYSETLEEHEKLIKEVILRFKNNSLFLKSSKCEILKTSIEFLVHIISDGTIKPNETNSKALREYREPKNGKETMSFVGKATFYENHIKSLKLVLTPLYDVMKKTGKEFEWTAECKIAFNNINNIKIITSDLILALPNFDLKFILRTDASKNGIGGELLQDRNG